MTEKLRAARTLAEKIRFSSDTYRQRTEGDGSQTEAIRNLFYQDGIRIVEEVTPSLSSNLDSVYNRLAIPADVVEAFVRSSSEIQARCFAGSASECVIEFTSSLVDILNGDEFAFVAGHELGHFLLGHTIATDGPGRESLEYYIQKRSQEISVDRIGLVACGSLNVAVSALMKTASGLTDRHLRFDVGAYVSQLRSGSGTDRHGRLDATHPSMAVRCRALLWFSMCDFFEKGPEGFSIDQVAKIDKRIQRDFEKFVDGPARKKIEEAKNDLAMWMAAIDIVRDGVFEKREQAEFAERFSEETLGKLKAFLAEMSVTEVHEAVSGKMRRAREDLEKLIPTNFEAEFAEIWNQSSS